MKFCAKLSCVGMFVGSSKIVTLIGQWDWAAGMVLFSISMSPTVKGPFYSRRF